tara:strand:+ start:1507 stop:1926 length:420 start_codon:yes stop_codon:yes gene_type:complete
MAFTNYKYDVGLRNVGSYQVSGQPYIKSDASLGSGSTDTINFPFVTQQVVVMNSGSASRIKVHFGDDNFTGAAEEDWETKGNYIQLTSDGEAVTFNVKCKAIHITSDLAGSGYQVHAALTNIGVDNMYPLTGSGIDDGV